MGFAEPASKEQEQISRWQFGAELSVILKFIAVRVKARGDGLLLLLFFFLE